MLTTIKASSKAPISYNPPDRVGKAGFRSFRLKALNKNRKKERGGSQKSITCHLSVLIFIVSSQIVTRSPSLQPYKPLFHGESNATHPPPRIKVLDITSVVDSSVPKNEGPTGDLGRSGSLHASESVYSGVSDFEGQGSINFHDFQHGALLSRNSEGESHLREAEWPDQDGTGSRLL
ncbi:hypothetical protein NE237_022480 [Protea cynaroides]|uniref:Uncharacterized protein n=1 Tax=Protea cynaroides TaxID=273540 RepID=A0A9Q0H9R6_9MAGN|nr:hypothetical protein NE237_022480 [Protea cynaroides]